MNEKSNRKIWKIGLLPRLQIDSIVASFLLKKFGEERFPGIKDAEYRFLISIPKNKDINELEKDGYVFIDMGGGLFDHHDKHEEGKDVCASYLVA